MMLTEYAKVILALVNSFLFSLIVHLMNRFPADQHGTMKSVVQYFQETYGFVIQHTSLPCLQVGNQQRPNYLPMEVSFECFINVVYVNNC